MTQKISVQVNGTPVSLNRFVASFVDHSVGGMIESLKNTAPIADLILSIDGESVDVMLNKKNVKINIFVRKILKSTVIGMVTALRDVSQPINNLKIEIIR